MHTHIVIIEKHNATVGSDVSRHFEKIKLSIFCDSLIFCYCCNKPDFACLFLLKKNSCVCKENIKIIKVWTFSTYDNNQTNFIFWKFIL